MALIADEVVKEGEEEILSTVGSRWQNRATEGSLRRSQGSRGEWWGRWRRTRSRRRISSPTPSKFAVGRFGKGDGLLLASMEASVEAWNRVGRVLTEAFQLDEVVEISVEEGDDTMDDEGRQATAMPFGWGKNRMSFPFNFFLFCWRRSEEEMRKGRVLFIYFFLFWKKFRI